MLGSSTGYVLTQRLRGWSHRERPRASGTTPGTWSLQAEIKDLAWANQAVLGAQDRTVNGAKRGGRKMVRDFSGLMLRAYDAEADCT